MDVGENRRHTGWTMESLNYVCERKVRGGGAVDELIVLENDAAIGEKKGGEVTCFFKGGEAETGVPRSLLEDKPPIDDFCPICFGVFIVPCKTSCGHWFCATCILQFWKYKAAVQQCKCPICCRFISRLTPEASLPIEDDKELTKVLKNVEKYNCLFMGGPYSLAMKALLLPAAGGRIIRTWVDHDRIRVNYYRTRLVALVLSFLCHLSLCDFPRTVPIYHLKLSAAVGAGDLGIERFVDIFAIMLVVALCLIGIFHRAWQRRHNRQLAAP